MYSAEQYEIVHKLLLEFEREDHWASDSAVLVRLEPRLRWLGIDHATYGEIVRDMIARGDLEPPPDERTH